MSDYCIFGGDFNGHHSCWGSNRNDHHSCIIHSAIENVQLRALNIGVPTRLNRPFFPDTAVDISVSSPNFLLNSQWEVHDCPHGSDHYPIVIRVPFSYTLADSHVPRAQQINKFNFNKADWLSFSSLVDARVSPRFTDDPLEAYESFTEIAIGAANSSIPKAKTLLLERASLIWWNDNCAVAVKARTTAFRLFRQTKATADFLAYKNQYAITHRTLKYNPSRYLYL